MGSRRPFLRFHVGSDEPGEWGIMFALVRPGHGCLWAGWGWDRDLPFSPVPRVHRGLSPRGRPTTSAAWCGFFIANMHDAPVAGREE